MPLLLQNSSQMSRSYSEGEGGGVQDTSTYAEPNPLFGSRHGQGMFETSDSAEGGSNPLFGSTQVGHGEMLCLHGG